MNKAVRKKIIETLARTMKAKIGLFGKNDQNTKGAWDMVRALNRATTGNIAEEIENRTKELLTKGGERV